MNKEIEKYVWYYLGVYIVVLLIFAAFQYFGECEGASLNCKTNWEKVKDILQTTAYILTPIVAIVGFIAWQGQKEYDKVDKIYEDLITFESDLAYVFKNLKEVRKAYEDEDESNILIIGSNIINLDFYHKFTSNFEKKIKVLNKYSTDEDFIKTVNNYKKEADKLAGEIHYFFSLYSNSVRYVQEKILPNSLLGITNLNSQGLEFGDDVMEEIPEVTKINATYWFSFIFRFGLVEEYLDQKIQNFKNNEAAQLKNELNKIKKIPHCIVETGGKA